MNIYTLHKAGSFRPPTLETVAEIENIPREKLPRPSAGVDENKPNGSTIQTAETRGSDHSSSFGEKTAPRHNVTVTHTNNLANNVTQNARQNVQQTARVSASRIDASGIITDTAPEAVPSKAAIDQQKLARRRKVKATAYPSRKNRHMNLIHIQAKDEFMIFEDNTDLVSRITTPSAVRTSPLETDILEFDHDEFAEEQSLFSAITVPKALRRKKAKKKAKSKSSDEDDLRLAPSYSIDHSDHEEEEQKEEEEEKQEDESPPVSPPKPLQTDAESQSPSTKGSERRGERQVVDGNDKDDASFVPKVIEEKITAAPNQPSSKQQNETEMEKREEASQNGKESESQPKEQVQSPEKESATKQSPGTTDISKEDSNSYTSASIEQVEATKAETTASVSKNRRTDPRGRITDKARGKRRQKVETQKSTPQKTKRSQDTPPQRQSPKSPEIAGVNKYTKSAKIDTHPITLAAEAALSLDVTATTAIDSTARTSNEGSNHDGSSHDDSETPKVVEKKSRKIPNSRKPKKSYAKWMLPTSYFCPCAPKRNQQFDPDFGVATSASSSPKLK